VNDDYELRLLATLVLFGGLVCLGWLLRGLFV